MPRRITRLLTLCFLASTSPAWSKEKVAATVEVTAASFNPETFYFAYRYSVTSAKTNSRVIDSFMLLTPDKPERRWGGTAVIMNPKGKIFWKGYKSYLKQLESNIIVWRTTGGKISKIAEILDPPPEVLQPGERLDDVGLDSRFLPGSIAFIVEPWRRIETQDERIARINKTFGTNYRDISEVSAELYEKSMAGGGSVFDTSASGKTLGPLLDPANKTVSQFLDYLIDQKHQAQETGWISGPGADGIVKSLDAKLDAAKESVAKGNNNAASGQLKAFVNEVQAQRGKHLNENAYLLLKLNAEYILAKLQAGSGKTSQAESGKALESETTPSSSELEFKLGEVYVFPNPAKGDQKSTFHIETGMAERVEIKIHDSAGDLVHEHTLSGAPASIQRAGKTTLAYEYALEVKLPFGVYLYVVKTFKEEKSLKATGRFSVVR